MAKLSGIHSESFLPPRWVLTIAGLYGLAWLIVQLKELCVLLVVGYCIAYVYQAPLRWCEGRKIGRTSGFFLVTGIAVGIITLLTMTALPTLSRQYDRLSESLPSYMRVVRERAQPYRETIASYLPEGVSFGEVVESPLVLLEQVSPDLLQRVGTGLWTALLGGYSWTLTLLNLTLLPFIVFYLAVDFKVLHRWILEFFPNHLRKSVSRIGQEIDSGVGAFVNGQAIVGMILFVFYALGLGILGVDLWLLLAVIAGFGNIIPYFGFLLGIVLSSVMALVTFGSFAAVFKVWALFGIVQALEGTVITPRIVGEKTGLSPLTIILALFAGGQLFGILGLLLAVPGAAVVKVLGRRLHAWVVRDSR